MLCYLLCLKQKRRLKLVKFKCNDPFKWHEHIPDKAFTGPLMTNCLWHPHEQHSVKFELEFKTLIGRKCVWIGKLYALPHSVKRNIIAITPCTSWHMSPYTYNVRPLVWKLTWFQWYRLRKYSLQSRRYELWWFLYYLQTCQDQM